MSYRPLRTSKAEKSDNEEPNEKFVTYGNLRIIPKELRFEGAFSNRRFKETITFQNCGKESVFIRILRPSLYAIQMNALTNGEFLAPGMKISRIARYEAINVESQVTGVIPVIINGRKFEYPIVIIPAEEYIVIDPDELDFGTINVNTLSEPLSFKLTNIGTKAGTFTIDTIRTDNLFIIASPSRGRIESKETVSSSISVACSEVGDFHKELWTRGSSPVRLILVFRIVKPKWLVMDVKYNPDFALIEFPPTYLGAFSERRVAVKNSSASKLMFCLIGVYDYKECTIDEADKQCNITRSFNMSPVEGILIPTESKIFSFRFQPKNPELPQGRNFCIVKLIGLDFQPVSTMKFLENFSSRPTRPSGSIISDTNSIRTRGTHGTTHDTSVDWQSIPPNENITSLYLFGLSERASVKIVPDTLLTVPLNYKDREERLLLITNSSERLSVIVSYTKTAYIRVVPSRKYLEPLSSHEFQVTILANAIGTTKKKIQFELSYQQHKDSEEFHVGSAGVDVVVTCLARTLYPLRVEKCRRIFLEKPLQTEVDLVPEARAGPSRVHRQQLFDNFTIDTCELLKSQPLLFDQSQVSLLHPRRQQLPQHSHLLLPLSIQQLYRIQIYPRYLDIRKIATGSMWCQRVFIRNDNEFPVEVTLIPHSDAIVCLNTYKTIVHRNSEEVCELELQSSINIGLFFVVIDIVLNQSFVHKVIISGEIISKVIEFDKKELVIDPVQGYEQYLDLHNPFNVSVFYTVHTLSRSFTFEPALGEIDGFSHHALVVKYNPKIAESEKELNIQVEGQRIHSIPMKVAYQKLAVKFEEKKLMLSNLPLNKLTKVGARLLNESCRYVSFTVMNSDLMPGITISPLEGLLNPRSTTEITLTFKIKACIKFKRNLELNLDGCRNLLLEIVGHVVVPKIKISPDALIFPGIAPFSDNSQYFTIKNEGTTDIAIQFLLGEHLEFTVLNIDSLKKIDKLSLRPKESRMLMLFFDPVDVTNHSFLLPMLLNDLLCSNEIKYLKREYVEEAEMYKKLRNVTIKPLEAFMALRITSRIPRELLWISSKHLRLKLPRDQFEPARDVLIVANRSKKDFEVVFRLNDIDPCFQISFSSGDCEESVLIKTLAPNEEFELRVEFQTDELNYFQSWIPISVSKYSQEIFATVTLEGIVPIPEFVCANAVIYLEPIPINCKSFKDFDLKLLNHRKICDCFSECSDENLIVTLDRNDSKRDVLKVNLEFSAKNRKILDTEIFLTCSCGGTYSISVKGSTESSFITNHAFLYVQGLNLYNKEIINKRHTRFCEERCNSDIDTMTREDISKMFQMNAKQEDPSYPAFPSESEKDNLKNYMEHIVEIVESWIYTQVFYYKKYLAIPDDFTRYEDDLRNIPYLKILLNLTNSSLIDKIVGGATLDNPSEDVLSLKCVVYKKVLNLLISFGGVCPHVEPEYLLRFEEFQELLSRKFDSFSSSPYNEAYYYLRSKQAWLDLLLQTFKIFGLKRSVTADTFKLSKFIETRSYAAVIKAKLNDIIYSREEFTLLVWLESNYNSYRNIVSEILYYKMIKLFDWDLSDGIVLIVVTCAYCPYITKEFENCYYNPLGPEQFAYNVSTLLRVWKMLGSKFIITVAEMLSPNVVQMIMLVSYLYGFLPSLSPTEAISMRSCINGSSTHTITLFNQNSYNIKYTITIFDNFYNSLSCNLNECVLKPKKKVEIELTYKTIFLCCFDSTLLISGESQGYRYASSLVFEIEATPDFTRGYYEFVIPFKLFVPDEREVVIPNKYPPSTIYEIYFNPRGPATIDDFTSCKTISYLQVPMVEHGKGAEFVHVDETGTMNFRFHFCMINEGGLKVYLLMRHKRYGDVGVLHRFVCINNKPPPTSLQLAVNQSKLLGDCLCGTVLLKEKCPKIIHVSIPSRNSVFWDGVQDTFFDQLNCAKSPCISYWKECYNKFSTVSIFQNLMRPSMVAYNVYPYIFNGKKTRFLVKLLSPAAGLTTVPYLEFSCAEPGRYIDLPIHIGTDDIPDKIVINLVSQPYNEHRFYVVKVIKNCDS